MQQAEPSAKSASPALLQVADTTPVVNVSARQGEALCLLQQLVLDGQFLLAMQQLQLLFLYARPLQKADKYKQGHAMAGISSQWRCKAV